MDQNSFVKALEAAATKNIPSQEKAIFKSIGKFIFFLILVPPPPCNPLSTVAGDWEKEVRSSCDRKEKI